VVTCTCVGRRRCARPGATVRGHLGPPSWDQRLWKEWLDKELAKAANDKTGRKDFLARLTVDPLTGWLAWRANLGI